ncbi:orotidine-5'-phosphate decarboxylase [Patescibacteria group bacterium]|nr:orotidine-5'-phosphate decarboxylase [Patescibacteria group bacterium]
MPPKVELSRHLELGEIEPRDFGTKLERLQRKVGPLCIGLDTDWSKVPGEFKELGREEGTFQFNKTIIDSTFDLVCAFKPNTAFYEDDPQAEAALERTVGYIHTKYPYIPVIGDIKRADIGNTNTGHIRTAFDRYGFDAVTVNPWLGQEALKPFLDMEDKGIIAVVKTSNPGSEEFQDLPVSINRVATNREELLELYEAVGNTEMPMYLAMAWRISRFWNKNNNCSIVVGATYPEDLSLVRKIAPNMQILLPGIGTQGGEVQTTVANGMDQNGQGMIMNASRSVIFATREEGESVGDAARREAEKLREEINYYRENPEGMTSSQKELADALLEIGAVKFGAFKLKLHEKNPTAPLSPIYIDLRVLRSAPPEIKLLACKVYRDLMKNLSFDLLADVPTAITPIVSVLSQITGIPMVTPRTDKKSYGSGAQIDGAFRRSDTAVLIDDLITEGDSKFPAIEVLEGSGINVRDIVFLVDREQGGVQLLEKKGYRCYAAFTISNLLRYYLRSGRIDQRRYDDVKSYLAKSRQK